LQNIISKPSEDKYRQIKGTIPKIASTLFSLTGANFLLLHMNFEEIEPSVYIYLEPDVTPLQNAAELIHREVQTLRQSFMSKEDREKAILLEQRRIEIAQKAKLEREKVERMKKLAEYDRQEKAGEKVDASVGNKLTFGANIVTFKPPVSKGG